MKKNAYLDSDFREVSSIEFYRDIFPVGSFERRGYFEDKKPNGIVTVISKDRKKGNSQSTIMFDDLQAILEVQSKEFVITNCIAYSGRNRTSKNGYSLYGIIIDLDYVTEHTLIDLIFQMQGGVLPMATYLVNSGNGIHVYYVFDEPIPLYDWVIEPLNKLKKGITDKVWNQYTSTEKNKQYQNIFQGFRVVGTQTKLGEDYLVRAFKTGYKIDVNSLNEFVNDDFKFDYDVQSKKRLTLEIAKNKYPEWYQSKIVEKKERGTFIYNKGMYYKWIDYINSGAYDGNRYHCLCVFFANAVKCGISKNNALEDAYSLLDSLNDMTKHKSNSFTEKDLLDASKYYNHRSHFLKANTIRYKTKIDLPIGKRNYRKQDKHLQGARAIRDINNDNWRDGNGRPSGSGTAEQQVAEWRKNNPIGTKAECNRQTKLDPKTIRKWWDDKGWNSLINEYSEKIIELGGEVRYTKQKYGGLVFEITYPLDSINQEKIIFLEQEAEKKSFTICEYCGAKGELRELKNSYLQTLCDKCCKIKEYQILRK